MNLSPQPDDARLGGRHAKSFGTNTRDRTRDDAHYLAVLNEEADVRSIDGAGSRHWECIADARKGLNHRRNVSFWCCGDGAAPLNLSDSAVNVNHACSHSGVCAHRAHTQRTPRSSAGICASRLALIGVLMHQQFDASPWQAPHSLGWPHKGQRSGGRLFGSGAAVMPALCRPMGMVDRTAMSKKMGHPEVPHPRFYAAGSQACALTFRRHACNSGSV